MGSKNRNNPKYELDKIAKCNESWLKRDGSKSPKARKPGAIHTNFSGIFPIGQRNTLNIEGEQRSKVRGINVPLDY